MARAESGWSSEASFTTLETPGGGEPVDPTHLAPARLPLELINPRKSGFNTWSRYIWNHSQMPYVVAVGVFGGKPPFTFSISGITGATVTGLAPDWNPKMVSAAEINIPANTSGVYTVTVTDMDGNSDSSTVSVNVDDSRFIFLQASGGNDGNSGTIGSPKQNFTSIWDQDRGDDKNWDDKIIVMRTGNYNMPTHKDINPDGFTVEWNTYKPKSFIGYPGERPTLTGWLTSNLPSEGFFNNTLGGEAGSEVRNLHDTTWQNITFKDGGSWFKFLYGTHHQVWYDLLFDGMDVRVATSNHGGRADNFGGIIYENGNSGGNHIENSAIKVSSDNCNSDGRNHYLLEYYCAGKCNADIITNHDSYFTDACFVKSSSQHIIVTSLSSWVDTYNRTAAFSGTNSGIQFEKPFDTVTSWTSVLQFRYCRGFKEPSDNGQGEDGGDGVTFYNPDDAKVYGQAYIDRCVVVAGIRPDSDRGDHPESNVYWTQSVLLNNKGWWGEHINSDHIVTNCIVDWYKDNLWANHIDSEGRLLTGTGKRYELGWEIN